MSDHAHRRATTSDVPEPPAETEQGSPPAVLLIAPPPAGAELSRALAADGERYRAVSARDLDEALAALRTRTFDALLLDPGLAPASDALDRLRQACGDAVLVVVDDAAHPGADEWLPRGSATAARPCLDAALEKRRLRRELREAREALALAEGRFRSIILRSADGVVIVGEDGRVRFVNPAAEALFGRPAAGLVGREFGFAVLAGETTEIDIVPRGREEPLVAELRASVTVWDGEPAQVISLRDITDRRRADERERNVLREQAAREHAERASSRARFLSEASARLDASLDPAATLASLAQLVVPRLADLCLVDLVEGDRLRRVAATHGDAGKQLRLDRLRENRPAAGAGGLPRRVIHSGEPALLRGLTPDRVRELAADEAEAALLLEMGVRSAMLVPLEAHGAPLGALTFGCGEREFDGQDLELAQEIGLRAARAIENARLYEAALAASQAKSDFLAVISHELRTPLNGILGYAQLLLEAPGTLAADQLHFLERIRSAGTHLLEIIEEILSYVDLETGVGVAVEAGPVRLGELVREIAELAEPLARERGLDFRVNCSDAGAEIITDARKLRRILLNLLTNAVKFTGSGRVELLAALDGEQAALTVADTGPGLEPAALQRVFDGFWVSDRPLVRQAGGTGLGLPVARRLAELLGGTLTVTSQPGVGSAFTVRVPVRPRGGRTAA